MVILGRPSVRRLSAIKGCRFMPHTAVHRPGYNVNAILPIYPAPLVGMQGWYDTVCTARKAWPRRLGQGGTGARPGESLAAVIRRTSSTRSNRRATGRTTSSTGWAATRGLPWLGSRMTEGTAARQPWPWMAAHGSRVS